MTTYYIWSGGGNTDGLSWANAFTRVVAGTAAKAAGDIFNIADDHSEPDATAKTLTTLGTLANPCYLRCVNRGTGLQSTGAAITVTGAGNSWSSGAGFWKVSGVNITAGDGTANIGSITLNGVGVVDYEDCTFRLNNNQNSSKIATGLALCIARNCQFWWGSSGQGFRTSGQFVVLGGSIHTSSIQVNPMIDSTSIGRVRLVGFDMDRMLSTATIAAAQAGGLTVELLGCLYPGSGAGTPTSMATPTGGGPEYRSAASGTGSVYAQEKITAFGAQLTNTDVTRTGGAAGPDSTGHSIKITTNSNTRFEMPYETLPLIIWNDSTAARTLTFDGLWGNSSRPYNNEVWMDVWYPFDSGVPLYQLATTRMTLLGTPAQNSSGTAVWAGSSTVASTVAFTLATTLTPERNGPTFVYFNHGKARTSSDDEVYIDTKPTWS